MFKQLKNNFFQAAFGSLIWITFLCSITDFFSRVPFSYIWHLIGIGVLMGLVFGVIYPYLWNHSTLKASTNIIICTLVNTLCGYAGIYLYSTQMFALIRPFAIGVLVLTLILHIIAFYFYSKYDNKKMAASLNQLNR
ncbi:hypothetical protein IGI39_003134 [Enterococcus sp. AZ135]|uniref:hypothetical protein n=1 Tax=unclassified Enterococcus TaxID=2608891 RepID=UPI003F2201C3